MEEGAGMELGEGMMCLEESLASDTVLGKNGLFVSSGSASWTF